MGSLLGPQSGSARAAALLGRPSRVAARGAMRPQDSMERLLAALKLALHDPHAAQMHSPFVWADHERWATSNPEKGPLFRFPDHGKAS